MLVRAQPRQLPEQAEEAALAKWVGDASVEGERRELTGQVVQPALGDPGRNLRGSQGGQAAKRLAACGAGTRGKTPGKQEQEANTHVCVCSGGVRGASQTGITCGSCP